VTGRDAARHQRVTELFLAASELPDGRRAAFLETACAGDAELAREVRSLLEADGAADDFLTRSAHEATHANHGVSWLGAADELTRVGPYELLGVLGEGGMGVVYEAEQEHPRRRVALKVLRTGLTSKSALRRFEYEAEVLGRLRHPGIAQVFDAGTAETPRGARPYFAMEVVRGEPLLRWAARKRLGLRERLRLFNHICEAVQHAHLKGVVHRDLKPSNILVDDEGQPRVLDFGIARAVEPGLDTDSWRTGEGQLLGTLPYMSPEQASGDPDGVDTRSDVYSLGVVLFELLTGELPLDLAGQNFAAAVATITGGTPRRLSQFERAYKGDLDTIAAKALDRDRRRRYASAAELALDITRYLRHEPIVARPASTTYHLRKFVARNKALVAVALTALAAIVVAFVLIGVALRRARQAERDSEENLREVERFSDQLVITDLTAEAENLFPRVPALKRQFQLWLERAREVQARREQHTALMQRLRAQTLAEQVAAGKLPADATEPFWPPEDVRVSWRYYMAEVTLAELDELALLMANVEERLRFADDIPRLTFETRARLGAGAPRDRRLAALRWARPARPARARPARARSAHRVLGVLGHAHGHAAGARPGDRTLDRHRRYGARLRPAPGGHLRHGRQPTDRGARARPAERRPLRRRPRVTGQQRDPRPVLHLEVRADAGPVAALSRQQPELHPPGARVPAARHDHARASGREHLVDRGRPHDVANGARAAHGGAVGVRGARRHDVHLVDRRRPAHALG
jgi:predicted Ser/Thr protein kinase